MSHKKSERDRKKGVGISLTPDILDRIDAVTPSDVSRSEIISAWILSGLVHAESAIRDGNPAYRLLGGTQ